ncbi:PREDICTED: signal recognition particle 19 kDa protein-like isoform X2 [Priapulus caudatus]|uniref:Signal recognition particle 19 kDa protein-like isoform X2 n=1 Tax=Priapulus caudatus TaxID=37621 RepID=A0ABM1EKY1_PRICU|nr:PREDICTED: signal recognition particle 19 kDa protein-like isoform X2 [Priapulus caudatus]
MQNIESKRWICIYPAYFNSKRTVFEGRRLPKSKCIDNPTASEINDVLTAAGCTIEIENKVHPREPNKFDPNYRGRIRVQLRSEDGAPLSDQFATRKATLNYLCEMIPKLKSRQQKQGAGDSGAQPGASAGGKDKRKGKKKR